MKYTSLVIALLVNSVLSQTCEDISVRKDWNNLNDEEKASYISSVKCMMAKPSLSINGQTQASLHEDFTFVHQYPGYAIHWVARFLPWHRWFIYAYHKELQECGYEGALPYWSWENDYQNLTQSAIWDSNPIVGFGGYGDFDYDNIYNSTVITDGAFANYEVNFPFNHKLTRNLKLSETYPSDGPGPYAQRGYDPVNMNNLTTIDIYEEFASSVESPPKQHNPYGYPGPHGAIHLAVFGDMATDGANNTAPNDPLFYMHHSNVDRVWASWQNLNEENVFKYAGNTDFYWESGIRSGLPATLEDPLLYAGVGALDSEDLQVKDVMNTTEWPLCYTYEDLSPWYI